MRSNKIDTPHNPEKLHSTDYDDASLKILRCLDRHPKSQANSVVIRRETGLPKHKVEQRIRTDGILVRARLVEKVGYDTNTNYAHPPKLMSLTQYARDAIHHGFFDDEADDSGQVVLDEEQFVEFDQTLSGLTSQFTRLSDDFEKLRESSNQRNQFLLQNIYYEVAMLREVVNELGVPKEVMRKRAERCRKKSNNRTNLKREFYSSIGVNTE
ncbi:hypothetical protein PM035_14030 [Halorubrum ezzemoulense]|uniref:hypothetical protein n=1 Tax=Halorubrum ezzemoulense TaxID=337243 RepID=UPI00232E86C5|nr:hypothetical protein [Halorubrum ezzemoulense]MDB2261924.1 hypothetical protein [Halorubrum ezzemoulense]MDB2268807.1 hypothetical protein [Halorubrum ezzemoulense]